MKHHLIILKTVNEDKLNSPLKTSTDVQIFSIAICSAPTKNALILIANADRNNDSIITVKELELL